MRALFEFLRKATPLLLLALAGGYFMYVYAVPCKIPLEYRVGSLDSRFDLTQEELRSALKEAEGLWEDAAGEDLFVYAEDGRLPVNLVYDTRQAITERNNSIKEDIDETSGTADSVKAAYDRANAQYQSKRAAYLAAQADYEAQLKSYNDSVAYWNARGGAPAKEYAALQSQKAALERSAQALESQRLALNTLAEEVNALSGRYNELAAEVNSGVDAINKTAGREFEAGLYTKSALGARIDIYEFSDHHELVRVLAHEMGHALGLEHNANPDSLMYELNESENTTPTKEDLAGLRTTCGLK